LLLIDRAPGEFVDQVDVEGRDALRVDVSRLNRTPPRVDWAVPATATLGGRAKLRSETNEKDPTTTVASGSLTLTSAI
jgi:hypothetical protein